MVATMWHGALLHSVLGGSVEALAKGWMSRLLKMGWSLGQSHFWSSPTTWPEEGGAQARDIRVPALMLTDFPPQSRSLRPQLWRDLGARSLLWSGSMRILS